MNGDERKSAAANRRDIAITLTQEEIAAVRRITRVDAVAPGVVALVREAIEIKERERSAR